jgi:dihydrofolate reductase
MRKLIYSMLVSVDGYVAGPDGSIGFAIPDDELHRAANDQLRETSVELYGRRMWEVMSAHWPTADQHPGTSDEEREFALLWQAAEKVVFSRTLTEVEHGARLVRDDPVEEIRRLKDGNGGPLAISGPTLAAEAVRAGLVDQYQLFLHPVVLGGGLPYLPPLERPLELELAEERRFGSGVTFLRYLA